MFVEGVKPPSAAVVNNIEQHGGCSALFDGFMMTSTSYLIDTTNETGVF